MLAYLLDKGVSAEHNEFLNNKWEETAAISTILEELKAKLDKKYHPEGSFSNFEFDFEHHQMIYYD